MRQLGAYVSYVNDTTTKNFNLSYPSGYAIQGNTVFENKTFVRVDFGQFEVSTTL
jgi:hypothetical protein